MAGDANAGCHSANSQPCVQALTWRAGASAYPTWRRGQEGRCALCSMHAPRSLPRAVPHTVLCAMLLQEIEARTDHKVCIVYGGLPPETRRRQAMLFNDPDSGWVGGPLGPGSRILILGISDPDLGGVLILIL